MTLMKPRRVRDLYLLFYGTRFSFELMPYVLALPLSIDMKAGRYLEVHLFCFCFAWRLD